MKTETICMGSWEITLPLQALLDCHHQGSCDAEVEEWRPKIDWDDVGMTPEQIRSELNGCGTWSEEELDNVEDNQERILWLAAGNYQDNLKEFIIQDWAGNRMFPDETFASFEEGWEYVYKHVDNSKYDKSGLEDENVYQDVYVEEI